MANNVRADPKKAGLISNEEKFLWNPRQVIDWLGLRWNAREATIHIMESRLRKINLDIQTLLNTKFIVSARTLASFIGK